jgi:circadian clock protein KaiC
MTERLSSGHSRLDGVLRGGLPANAINMVIGLPGTGKTVLAQQFVFTNATSERPALYLATVSEPFDKILHYGQTLRFFDPEAIGHTVFYEDLGKVLNERGLAGVLEHVSELIKEHRPGVTVIDSFKALSAYAEGAEYRRFLHELAGRLSAFPTSSFWLGEYGEDEIGIAPEFAVADAIICLSTARAAERETRYLRVLKLRGSDFASGLHGYRLSEDGIDVFPRLADPIDVTSYGLDGPRRSSGIPALDEMLADGYWPGASTLCIGPSGCGKTLMGLHFVFNGIRQDEPGLLATLQEHPTQLARIVTGFGWSLEEEGVELMYRSPVDLNIDQWVYDLLEAVERSGARRVLIDSLTDLRHATPDEARFREYMYSLLQRLSRQGVSMFMTSELADLFEVRRLSEFGISHLSDNVVLLQYIREAAALRRALTVLKTRASRHEPQIREFKITSDGILLGDPFAPAQELEQHHG